MALSTQANQLVKQKCRDFTRDPGIALQLKALWKYQAEHNGNPDLELVAFGNLGADAVVADVPCKVYVVYLKKQATATDAFYNLFDDITNDATAADAMLSLGLLGSGDELIWTCPKGQSFPTGVVHGSYTALIGANGSTPSTSGDGPDGFIIIGAA